MLNRQAKCKSSRTSRFAGLCLRHSLSYVDFDSQTPAEGLVARIFLAEGFDCSVGRLVVAHLLISAGFGRVHKIEIPNVNITESITREYSRKGNVEKRKIQQKE